MGQLGNLEFHGAAQVDQGQAALRRIGFESRGVGLSDGLFAVVAQQHQGLLGQEVELSESLKSLNESAAELTEEVSHIPNPRSITENNEKNTYNSTCGANNDSDKIQLILTESVKSPTAALIMLSAEVEREARETLACTGRLKDKKHIPISRAIKELDSTYGLPNHVSSSLNLFWNTRNKIVHGGVTDERNILSAIDSGIAIIRSLRAIPRESNYVFHSGVSVYSDPNCQNLVSDVKGIILKTVSPGGARTERRIFPTTKTYYLEGKLVSWEWNNEKTWGESWYRDPESNETKLAWSSSMEFVGRHLDNV